METKKKSLLEKLLLSIIYYYIKANHYVSDKIGSYKARRRYFKLKRTERVLLEILVEDKSHYYLKLLNENRKELNKFRNATYYSKEISK